MERYGSDGRSCSEDGGWAVEERVLGVRFHDGGWKFRDS